MSVWGDNTFASRIASHRIILPTESNNSCSKENDATVRKYFSCLHHD